MRSFLSGTPLTLMPIDTVGDHAGFLPYEGAVQDAAEHLLMDIAKLEAEKAEKGRLNAN
jgi:hypothetical protein